MTHEIRHELARRSRRLPDRDGSRYQTLKLVIQRGRRGFATVSLVYVDVGGNRLQDTRLAAAEISVLDEAGVPLPSGPLMRRALEALHL